MTIREQIEALMKEATAQGFPTIRRVAFSQDIKEQLRAEGSLSGLWGTPEYQATTEPGQRMVRLVFTDVVIDVASGKIDVAQPITFSRDGPTSRRAKNLVKGLSESFRAPPEKLRKYKTIRYAGGEPVD